MIFLFAKQDRKIICVMIDEMNISQKIQISIINVLSILNIKIRVKIMPALITFRLIFLIAFLILITKSDSATDEITASDSSLNQIMKPIKTSIYKQIFHKPINVSIGEQLSIVLPSFDSLYSVETMKFRSLNDDEYERALNQLETLNLENDDKDFQDQKPTSENKNQQNSQQIGTQVSPNDLPIKCTHIPPAGKVYSTISKIGDQTGYRTNNLQRKIYIHVSSRQLLYILNTQNMLLSAYYYNDINLKFLSSFQLPTNKNDHNNQGAQTQGHYSVTMTLNSKQSELYIFAPHGIWVVQTKTFLTNIKQISVISGFDVAQSNGLDKVIRGSESYFVGIKKMGKTFIIPEPSTNNHAIFTSITTFNDERIFPQDIAIYSSYLFILDVYKGVYVYKISADFKAKQLFKIDLQNYGGNYKIHIHQGSSLFVNFNDFDGSKVVEINVDLQSQKADLVRYFKNDDYISFMQTYSVLTSNTGFYLNEISNTQKMGMKQSHTSAQTLLFLVSNYQQIQIFPFNIDPRTINLLHNGVKIFYPKVKEVYHIFGDRFLLITEDTLDYVKISIDKPRIECRVGKKYNEESKIEPDHLRIIVKSNVSTCEFRDKLFRQKVFYNQNCELSTQYYVHLNDPEKSSLRKVITYGIVLLVLVAFILGLFCLVQWRNEKLIVLSRLKDEIMKFRTRHRKMQPFVEEPIPHIKQVEMEVPKDIQFVPNEDYN